MLGAFHPGDVAVGQLENFADVIDQVGHRLLRPHTSWFRRAVRSTAGLAKLLQQPARALSHKAEGPRNVVVDRPHESQVAVWAKRTAEQRCAIFHVAGNRCVCDQSTRRARQRDQACLAEVETEGG